MARTRFGLKQILGFISNRQNDTTNNADPTDQRIEYGWGAMTFGSAGSVNSEGVSFRQAFNSAPVVLIIAGGDQVSGAIALGNGGNTVHGAVGAKVYGVTTTGFNAYIYQAAGSNWSTGNIVYYHWIAIGN